MEVKLIAQTNDPVEVMWTAARTCYNSKSPIEMWENLENNSRQVAWEHRDDEDESKLLEDIRHNTDKRWNLVTKVLDSGHQSVAEHVYFTFAIEGISRACYDDKTEVLTDNGWKLFKNVDINQDRFITRNLAGNIELQKATNYIHYPYKGIMHLYKAQNLNLCVTPNHKLLSKPFDTRKKYDYQLIASEDVVHKRFYMTKEFNYESHVLDHINVKGYSYQRKNRNGDFYTKTTTDLSLDKKVFYPLLAWYLSDGSAYFNEKENSYCIQISQTKCNANIKNHTRERIIQLIQANGFTPSIEDRVIKFKNQTLGKFFKALGKSNEKYIPFNIFEEFNAEYARLFVDEYFRGDGNIDKNGCGKLYTASEILANQLYILCFMAGYTCKLNVVPPREERYVGTQLVRPKYPSYVLNVTLSSNGRNRNVVVKKDRHFSNLLYDGYVYCVTVPNHTLFVRRNGIAIWCGNCSHQLVRHRAGIVFSQQSQRYVEIKESLKDVSDLLYYAKKEAPVAGSSFFGLKEVLDKYFVTPDSISETDMETYFAFGNSLISYLEAIERGSKAEDARNFLPNATKTNITMSVNLRELIHLCNLRLCTRAQKEIRELFKLIKAEVINVQPRLAKYLVPTCEINGICYEHQCCGRKPHIDEVMAVYNTFRDDYISKEDYAQIQDSIKNPKINKKLKALMEMSSVIKE